MDPTQERWRRMRAAGLRVVLWSVAALALWALSAEALSAVAAAQTTTAGRPAVDDRRLVRMFDFEAVDAEGVKQGYGFDMPEHWYAVGRASLDTRPDFADAPLHRELIGRPGHSRHAAVAFDDDHAHSGDFSLRLGADGGDAGAFLAVRTVTAIPGSDYRITARVRTEGLERSGAVLRAYFIDQQGARIPGSASESRPLRTAGDWAELSVTLRGKHPAAADVGVELLLRQPLVSASDPAADHRVLRRDLSGAAWFDDVAIWQLPFAEIGTDRRHNVVTAPQTPTLVVSVRDLSGARLWSRVTVYDHALRPRAQRIEPVGPGRPTEWTWQPNLPGFGWYLLDLEVFDGAPPDGAPTGDVTLISLDTPAGTRRVGRAVNAMLSLPARERPRIRDETFAVATATAEADWLAMAPEALDALGVSRFEAPAWPPGLTRVALAERLNLLDQVLLNRADELGVQTALRLRPSEEQVTRTETAAGRASAAVVEPPVWDDWTRPTLRALGQRVGRWTLGDGVTPDLADLPDFDARAADIDRRMRQAAPGPTVLLPWSLTQPPPRWPAGASALAASLRWPQSVAPEGVDAWLDDWAAAGVDYELRLEPTPADRVAHEPRIADLLLRLIHGREAGAQRFTLEDPWAHGPTRDPSLTPGPLAGVFAQAAERLDGRQAVARFFLGRGIECVLFDGPGGPMLAAWVKDTGGRSRQAKLHLGDAPVAIDPWGNRSPLSRDAEGHRLTLTPTPVFVEGVDAGLARFRAGFVVDNPVLDAVQAPQDRVVTLTNPWRRAMSGVLVFDPPDGWSVQPMRQRFSIQPGSAMRLPIRVRFPVSQPGGPVQLRARFEVEADRARSFTAQTPMEIRFAGMRLDARAAAVPNPETGKVDLVISAVATNTGDRPRTVYLFAQCGPLPRQETLVAQIGPGASVIRPFVFEDAAEALRDNPIRVGLREPDGPAVLNKVIDAVR